jgi:hypothetical protein
MLHVAASGVMGATTFYTFDARQADLVRAFGKQLVLP